MFWKDSFKTEKKKKEIHNESIYYINQTRLNEQEKPYFFTHFQKICWANNKQP